MPEAAVSYRARELDAVIGGRPAILLEHPGNVSGARPHFLNAEILPGLGMNLARLNAWLPDAGMVNVLASGGAVLFPFADRIRGRRTIDPKMIETTILRHTVPLPAIWHGRAPGAERCARDGFMENIAVDRVERHAGEREAAVTGYFRAGSFQGHWLSEAVLGITIYLRECCCGIRAVAENIGREILPAGFGWRLQFALPSHHRRQARMVLAARHRIAFDNDDDLFPTGQLLSVHATPYDFSNPDGVPLGELYLDDCFVDLGKNPRGHLVCELLDPAAGCGLRVTALSPEVKALRIRAPVDYGHVSVAPQFNWIDPFSPVWGRHDTGMVLVPPGRSVTFHAEIDVFPMRPFRSS